MKIRHTPLRDQLFITANMAKSESGIILLGETGLDIQQEVLKVGPDVKGLVEGDTVFINFDKYTKMKSQMNKVNKNPMTSDGEYDNVKSTFPQVEVPVYELDGVKVICLSEYELLPWKLREEKVDKSKIVDPNKLN